MKALPADETNSFVGQKVHTLKQILAISNFRKRDVFKIHPEPPPLLSSYPPHEVYLTHGMFRQHPNDRRCTMKVSRAVDFHLQNHLANSKIIPSKHVSSSLPVSLPYSANAISQAFPRRRSWNFCIPREKSDHSEPEKWACRRNGLCSTKNNG